MKLRPAICDAMVSLHSSNPEAGMSVEGHFRQIDPLPTLSALSASLRSRPNLRTAANRRGVPKGDQLHRSKQRVYWGPSRPPQSAVLGL
jgi:hypothetical protein